LQATELLKQAVARDPLFFQAYCQLAFTEINIYGLLDPSPEYLAQAEAALQSAARLRPDAGETHLARARNLYWGYLDYDGALRELEIARQSLPGEDWIFSLKGYIERRQGRWEECIRDLERATELDPRNVLTLQQLALTYQQLRRYAEEKSTYERILTFEPNDPVTKSLHAFVELDSKADTRPLHEVIDSIRDKNPAALSSVADNWLLCAFAERDPAAARKALIALGENPPSLGPIADVRVNRPFMEGAIATRSPGDLSYGQLKLMPFWDPLRSDPRFEAIVASLAPKYEETTQTAGVSQNEAGGRRATWMGSSKGELAAASESNALQFAAATSRSIRRSSTPDRRSVSRDRAGAQQR